MKRHSHLLVVGLLVLVGACKHRDPEPDSRAQLLTDKKWQLNSLVFSYPGSADINSYAQLRICSRDDYRQFNSPNTYVYDEGPTKCSVLDPQTQLGVWALSNNDTEVTITDPNNSDTYTIVELTDKTLKMTMPVSQSTGIDGTLTFTYSIIK